MKAKVKKLLFIIPLSACAILGIFFMYISSEGFARKHLIPVLEEKTQFTIESDSIDISLLKGEVTLKKVSAHSGPNTIEVSDLTIKVDLLACINQNFKVHTISLNEAKINLTFDATGKIKSDPNKIKTISIPKKSTNKPKKKTKQNSEINPLKNLFKLPQEIANLLQPIPLPSFHIAHLSIQDSTLEIKKDNRYGKAAKQHIAIESFLIQNLGAEKNFNLISQGSYHHQDSNGHKFETKKIDLSSTGKFNSKLTSASNHTTLVLSKITSTQIIGMNDLKLTMDIISELNPSAINIKKASLLCEEGDQKLSAINLTANAQANQIKTELNIDQLSAALLNIGLSLAPKSKTITRWLSLTKKAGHKPGFADTHINGKLTFDLNDTKLFSHGKININQLPVTTGTLEKLSQNEINSKLNFDITLNDQALDNFNLKLMASDIHGNTFLELNSEVKQNIIFSKLNSSNLDLSLLNNFMKDEQNLQGKLTSQLVFNRKDNTHTGTFFLSSKQVQHNKISEDLDGSLFFEFNNTDLKTTITKFNSSLSNKTFGKVDLKADTLNINSQENFTKNTITSPQVRLNSKIYKSPQHHNLPSQNIVMDLNDFSISQSQESLSSKSLFSINGAKIKEFNKISSNGFFEFNANLLNQIHALILKDLSISNKDKKFLNVKSLKLQHHFLSDQQVSTLYTPKLHITDVQEFATLLNNTSPKYNAQALSSEIKINLSTKAKENITSARIELPSLKLMDLTAINLAANLTRDNENLSIKNFSLVQGAHVLNLNASYNNDSYQVDNFNGTLDLGYIHSIIKKLLPNSKHSFEGIATFNETKFSSTGKSPEEIFINLQNGKIDWDITKLKLDFKKEEKTFISKNLGFKPENLRFDEGELKIKFAPKSLQLQSFKLMGNKGGVDIHGEITQNDKKLNSQFFTWGSFIGSEYLHLIPPETILNNINELDDFLDYNKEKEWYEFDDHVELLSSADDGKFSTLLAQIQFNAESKFGPYISYLESAKKLSEGKLNKQSAKSVLDIFKQREEERQIEREKAGKKKKESKTKKVLDLLDGLF
jgi:hypothetical protein